MRYYSTQRPIGPGTFPRPAGTTKIRIHNFDTRTYCPEIGRQAWGWIDYPEQLSEKDARDYELISEK